MKTSPALSVIIPTYNRAAYLRRTLDSVFEQTISDYEVIVVDDGSKDSTEKVIAQLVKDKPAQGERIRYLFQRNQGKSVALNYGLSEARGDWIAFQDSDDLWLPNKIEEQFRAIRQSAPHAEACFTDARYLNNPSRQGTAFERAGIRFGEKRRVLDSPAELIGKFWIFMQSILLHSRVMAKVGEFDPCLWTGQDEDFVFRLSLQTKPCCVNLPLLLVDCDPRRRDRLSEIRVRHRFEALELRRRMYEKWLRLSDGFGHDLQRRVRRLLRGVHSEEANWHLVNGEYGEARRAAARAARIQLRPGIAAKWCLAATAPALARRIVIRRSEKSKPLTACRSVTRSCTA
jgi:glycosyltransferase involved in cell wall biosynthesis